MPRHTSKDPGAVTTNVTFLAQDVEVLDALQAFTRQATRIGTIRYVLTDYARLKGLLVQRAPQGGYR